MHLYQRGQVPGVAEIVGVLAAGQGRTGSRFDGNHLHIFSAPQLFAEERKRNAGEIRSAAGAADDDIRIIACHFKLFDGFLADHGLVHQYVVENAAQ